MLTYDDVCCRIRTYGRFITRDYYASGLSYGENVVNVSITIAPRMSKRFYYSVYLLYW